MEGIGAAEIVLIHQQELRDALVRQRSNKQRREGVAGSDYGARGGVLVRLMSGWAACRRAAYFGMAWRMSRSRARALEYILQRADQVTW